MSYRKRDLSKRKTRLELVSSVISASGTGHVTDASRRAVLRTDARAQGLAGQERVSLHFRCDFKNTDGLSRPKVCKTLVDAKDLTTQRLRRAHHAPSIDDPSLQPPRRGQDVRPRATAA